MNAEAQKTKLEEMITAVEAMYSKRSDDKPLTRAGLATFVTGTLLPLVRELRAEYTEGFEVLGDGGDGDDDGEDDSDLEELVVVGRNLLLKVLALATLVLQHAGHLDEQGVVTATCPDVVRESLDQTRAEVQAFLEATAEVEVDEDDGTEEEGAQE